MHQQFSLSWLNIRVEVLEKKKTFWKTSTKNKLILNNVSGIVQSSSLVAVMGASGSGKTTLLQAISGRLQKKKGFIKINNTIISNDKIKNISGYVHQQDIFTENLTVLEHLRFMAGLQLRKTTVEARYVIIKKILFELNLEIKSDTLIKYLSGGERRRLSLAGELFNNPYILFCDEPTTGLDSFSAILIVQKLQEIALSGKIVIATIHQPSSELFQYFNDITLLAEGRLVFQGNKNEADQFFESVNLFCPSTYNPADFYIKCLAYEDVSSMSENFKKRRKEIKQISYQFDHLDNIDNRSKHIFFYELKWLIWRAFIDIKHAKNLHFGCYILVLIELTLVAFVFAFVNLSDPDSVQNIQGILSFIGSEFTYTNMYAVINVFPSEVVVFLKEQNLYSPGPYFISKIISMIPLCFISTITYMSVFFLILNFLKGFQLWLKMTYTMFLISVVSCCFGLSFSATFSKVEHVDLFMGTLELVLLLLSGFLVRLDTVPSFLSWIRYLSPFYYSFDSLSSLFWRDMPNIGNCTTNETIPCYSNGNEVLQDYSLYKPYDTSVYNVLYLHILIVLFCLIGYAGLLRKKYLHDI